MRLRPRWLVRLAAGLILHALVPPALAADAANPATPHPGAAASGGAPAGGDARADAAEGHPGDPMDRLLPEVNFQDASFDDVVDFLRDVNPGFQAVIVRDDGAADGRPVVRLRLKDVPMRQVLEVLQTAHPELKVEPVQHPERPTVYVIRVEGPGDAGAAGPAGAGGRAGKFVQVYQLSNEIAMVLKTSGVWGGGGALEPEMAKMGLEHVLSLLEGVTEAVGDRNPPTLAVHEGTQSLIVTGTADQHALVNETLASLRGERRTENRQAQAVELERRLREVESASAEREARLQRELEVARRQADELQSRATEHAVEVERLRIRLEAAEAAAANERRDSRAADGLGEEHPKP
jgi:hypothetical protein